MEWVKTCTFAPNIFYFEVKTINIITLGCSKNTVDSERMARQFCGGGYNVLHNSPSPANVVVINTCGFIQSAKQEAVDTILHYAQQRRMGGIERLFVTGCLCERYADDLRAEIPEVDRYFGVNSMPQILAALNADYRPALLHERLISTPRHYAYLKIADGCRRQCSFCAIPIIKGKYASVPMPSLIAEAQDLARQGARELILVAQDLADYGLDINEKRQLPALIEALTRIDGIEWVRLHYLYPDPLLPALIAPAMSSPKLCRYLDVPIQHISDRVLKSMRRGYSKKDVIALIERLRRLAPDIALRTTLMTGYPCEDEGAFAELLQFVEEAQFECLGAFAYSSEDGTHSAACLPDSISSKEKQTRLAALMTLQSKISASINARRVGGALKAVVDGQQDGYWRARSQYQSPEVDGEILIDAAIPLETGRFYNVNITASSHYDLYGTPAG